MNKSPFVCSKKPYALAAIAVGMLMVTSCADTYDGGDTFKSDVRNAQLASPAEGDITITPNTNGDQMTISWPVVYGAGGYELSLYDLSDESMARNFQMALHVPLFIAEMAAVIFSRNTFCASESVDKRLNDFLSTTG